MSEALYFLYPTFLNNLNVTVRNGRKWDLIVNKLPFPVPIKETETDNFICGGEIVGKLVIKANEIPGDILSLEHDQGCTYRHGLFKVMKEAYGETWQKDSEVTVLFFKINVPEYNSYCRANSDH